MSLITMAGQKEKEILLEAKQGIKEKRESDWEERRELRRGKNPRTMY